MHFFFWEVSFGYYSYQRFADLYVFAAAYKLGNNNNNKTREACSIGSTSDGSHASANTHKHMKSALFEFSSRMLFFFFFAGSPLVCLSPDSVLPFRAKQQSVERHFCFILFFFLLFFLWCLWDRRRSFFFFWRKEDQAKDFVVKQCCQARRLLSLSLVSFSVSDTQTFFLFFFLYRKDFIGEASVGEYLNAFSCLWGCVTCVDTEFLHLFAPLWNL